MTKDNPKSRALALYSAAQASGDCEAYRIAADALALALAPPSRATASPSDLNASLRPIKKGCQVVEAIAEWSDGSLTFQHVAYSDSRDRLAAAFQACDKLRRLRNARALRCFAEGHTGSNAFGVPCLDLFGAPAVDTTVAGPVGVRHQSSEWLDVVRTFPLPHLVALSIGDDTWEAPEGSRFGAGDGQACGAAFAAMKERVAAEWERMEAVYAERRAELDAEIERLRPEYEAMMADEIRRAPTVPAKPKRRRAPPPKIPAKWRKASQFEGVAA